MEGSNAEDCDISDWTTPSDHCNGGFMEKLLLAVVAAIAHPFAPLVVGPNGAGNDHKSDDD